MERISKAKAKKEFANGKTITMVPCKMNINSMWSIGYSVNINDNSVREEISFKMGLDTTLTEKDAVGLIFDDLSNSCSYYNCNFQCGRYLHYYVED